MLEQGAQTVKLCGQNNIQMHSPASNDTRVTSAAHVIGCKFYSIQTAFLNLLMKL